MLKGPCSVGPHSQVKPMTVIHAGTTIGPVCKVGGEISNSIVTAYSNKSHEGYLGDSYVGAWVNLGAPVSSQLALAARTEGLVIGAGPRFGLDGVFERFLRIPFGMPADQLDRGVDALAAAWHSVARRGIRLDDANLAHVV